MRVARLLLLVSLLALAASAGASQAGAAVQVGQLNTPYTGGSCGGIAVLQDGVPTGTNSYKIPSAGVITSWQTRTGPGAGTMKLKVFRRTANESAFEYDIVGEDGPRSVAKETSPTFTGTHIPVSAGDFLGGTGQGTNCTSYFAGQTSYHTRFFDVAPKDPAVGTKATAGSTADQSSIQVIATVEPDADLDGYGDETQDQCPAEAATHAPPCVLPKIIVDPPPPPDIKAPRSH